MAISPFEFVKAINKGRDIFGDHDNPEEVKKAYDAFIINKAFSFSRDTLPFANELNQRSQIPGHIQFAFLLNIVRPRYRQIDWVKAHKSDDLKLVKEYYGCNNERAQEALTILTSEDIDEIKKRRNKGGDKQ